MKDTKVLGYLRQVLECMPENWTDLTTHRLDIYNEEKAKTDFITHFEKLCLQNSISRSSLEQLPTAYDYIRLGHPLSCILEWSIGHLYGLTPDQVISFSSQTTPLLAILRKNLLEGINTQIIHKGELPVAFDVPLVKQVYGYSFEIRQVQELNQIEAFEGTTIFVQHEKKMSDEVPAFAKAKNIDFSIHLYDTLGSIILVHDARNHSYIPDIQHVRRRETIAMTPSNSLIALHRVAGVSYSSHNYKRTQDQATVLQTIKEITRTQTKALVGSSGLSIQYAIMMGLIYDALENHKGKEIKFVVPPNCYGGTNDQARRVAACLDHVSIVDLPVDGDHDMVQSVDQVLNQIARDNAVPYIIAEIPTNPRVEVPDLIALKNALCKERKTATGEEAVAPVFILDQTFCPNVHFLGEGDILSTVKTISYTSGSKFPSGGKCTAGYCVSNLLCADLLEKIETHLKLCDNEATDHQMKILAEQLPSMNQRIKDAYLNTRSFVDFISKTLPEAKINFVSHELAQQGFTPSVFSLDLPTQGNTPQEKETYKRKLNHKLIDLMITKIPEESKYCVSYGQLHGCYWTIPATSTQGTTKEGDKDYIARVSVSPDLDLERHKEVFVEFVKQL